MQSVYSYFATLFEVTIGLTFLISALSKLANLSGFENSVFQFGILPQRFVILVARVFLGLELCIFVLLLINNLFVNAFGYALALLLLFVFTFALLHALRSQKRIICSCFGQSSAIISTYDVIRNLIMIILCVVSFGGTRMDPFVLNGTQYLILGCYSLGFALIISRFSDVIGTMTHPFLEQR